MPVSGGRVRRPSLPEAWRDPGLRAAAVLVAFALTGFAVIGLAWAGAAAKGLVVLQLPWLVSGGLVGLALVGIGMGLLDVHLGRRQAALRRIQLAEVVRDTSELAEAIAARVEQRRAAKRPPSRRRKK